MKDFPRAKEGRERTFALLSPFSPCEGGARRGRRWGHYNDNCFVNFIVFFVNFLRSGLQANTSPKSKWPNWKNHTQGLATGL